MFKSKMFLIPVALAAFAGACATLRVTTDYNHQTDFAQFHTYSWLKVHASDSLWENRIRRDVNQQFAAKGWQEVPSGGQAAVTAFGATREMPSLETFYDGFGPDFGGWYWRGWGYGGGFGGGMSTTQVEYTPVGSLVVDVFNGNSKHLIWRGEAKQVLSGSPEKNEQKLMNAVSRMFANFPPRSLG